MTFSSSGTSRSGAYGLLIETVERRRVAGRLHGRSPEVVAVSAWSMVHGLSALWISGRLAERLTEQDPQRLAAAVSDPFVDAVLPPSEAQAGKFAGAQG
ncbi:MAG: hypothetical protein ACRDOU_14915, partial [Streptosporangiaceae bacterium]